MSDVETEVEGKIEDLRNSDVVTKYRKAGDICNAALDMVAKLCVADASIVEVCTAGDAYIEAETAKLYKKGKVEKGIGFPTCLSVNHVVGHYSPMETEDSKLVAGDLLKIDLGVHIDGYCSVAARTIVVGGGKATGKQGDVLAAAWNASEAAIRLLKAGNKNTQVTEAINKIAEDFKCKPVQGVLSHEMNRFIIDGDKVIINREDIEQKVDEVEFAPNEVYAIDIVMSTGDGKPAEVETRTTVYKRAPETTYRLKLKASRAVLTEVDKRFPCFPFTIRACQEKKTVKFGIKECVTHELVHAYPVLFEKEGEFVAHIKFTAMILPNGTTRITKGIDQGSFESDFSVSDADIIALLKTSAGKKKKKNKKTKKKPAAAAQ